MHDPHDVVLEIYYSLCMESLKDLTTEGWNVFAYTAFLILLRNSSLQKPFKQVSEHFS